MSPAKKRATKSARKTMKKATRKTAAKKATKAKKKATSSPAKSAAAKKATRKAAKKTAKQDTGKTPAKKTAKQDTGKTPAKKTAKQDTGQSAAAKPSKAPRGDAAKRPARPRKKRSAGQTKHRIAQPLESAEKKPGLGAKWACFSCGAKFYDLNRPDPICPKCQTDQREQPLKRAEVPRPPPAKRPAAAPISRLLDEEEASEATLEEDADSDDAAELDIGKLNGEVGYLDDAEFNDDSDG